MRDYKIIEACPEAWSVGFLVLTYGLVINGIFCFVVYSPVLQLLTLDSVKW
jgi:hypothetical protein